MSVLKLIHKPLSDGDLRRLLGYDLKILTYPQLADLQDLDSLLPAPTDSCVLLYEEMPNSGHWTGLLKYQGMYEHFDSYGVRPDSELHWIDPNMREKLNEKQPFLSELLKSHPYIYNTVKFQIKEHRVNTCGSHVAFRLYNFKNSNMNLKQYQDYMKELKANSQMSYDFIVSEWVRKMI